MRLELPTISDGLPKSSSVRAEFKVFFFKRSDLCLVLAALIDHLRNDVGDGFKKPEFVFQEFHIRIGDAVDRKRADDRVRPP